MFGDLILTNFGPIKNAEINTKNLTLFVGPQASGKSVTSILFFLFNNLFENLNVSGLQHEMLSPDNKFLSLIKWVYGSNLDSLLSPKTYIQWGDFVFEGSEKKCKINKELQVAIEEQSNYYPPTNDDIVSYHNNIFIPAERTIYSLINPDLLLNLRSKISNWPGSLILFYEVLSEAMRIINDPQKYIKDHGGWAGISIYLEELEVISKKVGQLSKSLMGGNLDLKNPQNVTLEIRGKRISVSYAASGQKEVWPYLVMLQSNFLACYRAHRSTNFFFEEPESHLHPRGQLGVFRIINTTLHSRENYLITTHSPYVLYFINNSILRGQEIEKITNLNGFFDSNDFLRKMDIENFIQPNRVAAYAFNYDGLPMNIMNSDGLLDESELDDVANELGIDFSEIQENLSARFTANED